MKTTTRGLLLCAALFFSLRGKASVEVDSLGQVFQMQAIEAVNSHDRSCFFAMLADAGWAYRASGDLEGWLKLYKEAGKALRQSSWPDAVPQAVAVMEQGVEQAFGRTPATPGEWDALIWLHVNLGYLHLHYQDDYQRALVQYEAAYRLFQQHFKEDDYYTVNYIYRPLANLYSRFGDFQTAVGLLRTANRFFKATGRTSARAKILNDLSIAEELAGEPDAALGHIEEALHLEELSPKDLVLLHSGRARVLGGMGKNKAARQAINEAFRALPQVTQVPPAYLAEWEGSLWHVRGSISAALGQWDTAAGDFAQGEGILRASGGISYRRALAKLLVDKGEMLARKGDYPAAVRSHQQAIQALLPNYAFQEGTEMPSTGALYAENTFSDALTGWGKSLWLWYQQEGGKEKLDQILLACDRIFEVEQMLRRRHQGEFSKLFSVQDVRMRAELGIRAALELQQLTGQEEYIKVAFEFAERTKSLLLLEAIHKHKAEQGAALPQSVLDREQALQQALARAEERWFQLQSGEATIGKQHAAERALLQQRQTYDAWVDSLEQQYPEYYQMKYDLDAASVGDVQESLAGTGQALVEYFIGNQMAFAFVITAGGWTVVDLHLEFSLKQKVTRLRTAIEAFQFARSDRQRLCSTYRSTAFELYEALVAPLEVQLKLPGRLLIVPDGSLGLLPFDALLAESTGHCDFRKMPYLVQQYEISYAYSATFQQVVCQRPARGEGTAAFAPAFDGRKGFGPLTYNQLQASAIADLLGGEAFLAEEATQERLSEVAGRASILHFATHAQANTSSGNFSFIVFSDGQGGYDSLFVNEIYLLPLQAELVVLNGCETFLGRWYDGEGVINLARSFLVAGANSVVASLWAINDDESSRLMNAFYREIRSGNRRSAALRLARQQQIASGGKLGAHPVYWAAFHMVGDTDPLSSGSWPHQLWWWVLLASGLVLGAIWWKYQRV